MKRVFGIVSLVVPSLLAAAITLDGRHERIAHVTSPALAALWVVMMGALVMRLIQGQRARRADDLLSHWDHIDVLTSSGASMKVLTMKPAGWWGAALLFPQVGGPRNEVSATLSEKPRAAAARKWRKDWCCR